MTLLHDMIVVRRSVAAPVDAVFAAWRETRQLEVWSYPGDASWTSRIEAHDFAVGGIKRVRFGPRGEAPYCEESRYLDIRTHEHIINSERILAGDGRLISTSLISIEFAEAAGGCDLAVSDQIALLDEGDSPEQRRGGWHQVLDRLAAFLRE
jgi:uncharacterized protein YndB with AHSA1/START domain